MAKSTTPRHTAPTQGVLIKELSAIERRLEARIDGIEGRLNVKFEIAEKNLDIKALKIEQRLNGSFDSKQWSLENKINQVHSRLDLHIMKSLMDPSVPSPRLGDSTRVGLDRKMKKLEKKIGVTS